MHLNAPFGHTDPKAPTELFWGQAMRIAGSDSRLLAAVHRANQLRVLKVGRGTTMRYISVIQNHLLPFLLRADLPPGHVLPISSELMGVFTMFRIDETGSHHSGEDAVNAVKWLHKMLGIECSRNLDLRAKEHIEVIRKLHACPKKRGRVADASVVRLIFDDTLHPGARLQQLRLAAIVAAQLGGFLRAIDVLRLTRDDIFILEDRIVLVATQTKTDRYRQGHIVTVMRGNSECSFCEKIEQYLAAVDLLAYPSNTVLGASPVFRRITGGAEQRLAAPKLPCLPHVSRSAIAKDLAVCLERHPDQSLVEGITLHGFRATAATVAVKKLPLEVVKRQGNWSPDSTSVHGYIEPSASSVERPSQVLSDYVNRLNCATAPGSANKFESHPSKPQGDNLAEAPHIGARVVAYVQKHPAVVIITKRSGHSIEAQDEYGNHITGLTINHILEDDDKLLSQSDCNPKAGSIHPVYFQKSVVHARVHQLLGAHFSATVPGFGLIQDFTYSHCLGPPIFEPLHSSSDSESSDNVLDLDQAHPEGSPSWSASAAVPSSDVLDLDAPGARTWMQ